MKVLQVIPSISEQSGGPGQAIIPMCRSLLAAGVEVVLATTDHELAASSLKSQVSGSEFGIRNFKNVPSILFQVQSGQSFKYSRPFAHWLNERVADYDLVHIHAVFNHASIAAARACRKKHVPYVVRPLGSLDPWSMKQKAFRKKVFWHLAIKNMLINASAIHYTSVSERQVVEESLGLNHGVVVPLGIDLNAVKGFENQVEFFNGSLSPSTNPYILVLSRLLPTKGLDVLLDAFLSLLRREEFYGWRLVFAGEGPEDYVESLKRKVREEEATDSVTFRGWLAGQLKEAALRDCSLLALPSYHENFGLCVMESLAYGNPVLVSPYVNLAAEIEAAVAGWISEVNATALEETLAVALSSEAERLRRGENGRRVAENYAWPNVAKQLIQVYGEIISNVDQTSSVLQHA